MDRELWHGGGMDSMGSLLAVPISGKRHVRGKTRKASEVRFFDMAAVTAAVEASGKTPQDVARALRDGENKSLRLSRPDRKAYAVALARMPSPDGRILAIVWDDSHLYFYYRGSRDAAWHLEGRVRGKSIRKFVPAEIPFTNAEIQKQYQNINLVYDPKARLFYLVNFRNTAITEPFVDGKDYADVFAFSPLLDPSKPVSNKHPRNDPQGFRKLLGKRIVARHDQCSFNAGGGLHVTFSGHLYIYGTPFWLRGKGRRFVFSEYV
jgi:hypothetical protein